MIHDVSTDADDPPRFIALLELRQRCKNGAHYSGLRGAAHAQRYADLKPVVFTQSPVALYQGALAVAQASGWAIAAAVQVEGRIEATATTRLLRFKDDVVIRIRANDNGARLDIVTWAPTRSAYALFCAN